MSCAEISPRMLNIKQDFTRNPNFNYFIENDHPSANGYKLHHYFPLTINFSLHDAVLLVIFYAPLRKHAYSNILKILPPETESFQIKILIFFHISTQNIDCGTR